MYELKDYDYELPAELIATEPAKKRDHSRLLVLDKKSGKMEHKHFYDIVDYLQAGDVLVMNNSKVIPARLIGKKQGSGGRVEVFLHKRSTTQTIAMNAPRTTNASKDALPGRLSSDHTETLFLDYTECLYWECLIGAKNIKVGQVIEFADNLKAEVIKNNEDGTWLVAFDQSEKRFMEIVEKIGQIPLPPYIEKQRQEKKAGETDVVNYQTVYADDSKPGSVAAPTAGLHFTPELIEKLKAKGVAIEFVTLYVGLGTFAPVKTEDIRQHEIHSEYVEIKRDTLERILKAKKEGKRIIAVGTTSTRTLEAVGGKLPAQGWSASGGKIKNSNTYSFWTNIFIYPGYEFKLVDAMITNFHLPKSSLIMLVSALAGKDNIDNAYREAIKEKYRFYSYGDGMFIY